MTRMTSMNGLPSWRGLLTALLALLFAFLPLSARGQTDTSPMLLAQAIRADLSQAQIELRADKNAARQLLESAQLTYDGELGPALSGPAAEADARARAAFAAALTALADQDSAGFAAARADIWTAFLAGGYAATEQAIQAGDGQAARQWLALREFRTATRFARPGADATRAVTGLNAGSVSREAALQALRADLLDTYQARLVEALGDLTDALEQGYAARGAEYAALAQGYFAILAPAYGEQRGADARAEAENAAAALRLAVVAQQSAEAALAQFQQALTGFRAAPLSLDEQTRRAGQLLQFVALVPVEYARGVKQGQVTHALEVQEAATFLAGARAAFSDLRNLLEARDTGRTQEVADALALLDRQLQDAQAQREVAAVADIEATTESIVASLKGIMPAEWQQRNSSADFDVLKATLDQMERAVANGQYEAAESARLQAYAILESGPEARLQAFAPQLTAPIEELFWYGQGEHPGLAALLARKSPPAEVAASRQALDGLLKEAEAALTGSSAPEAVAANALLIVFREGLEAVLILASLMGSLKIGAQRGLRRPLWLGAGVALLASVGTWFVARGALIALAGYGEKLEAVVSLIAIAVLLLITNWFFHDVYWTDWMAGFHRRKRTLLGSVAGQSAGFVLLGFTSIYREGFETILFLQALVLASGPTPVLMGVAAGLLLTLLVGVLVFGVQARLPHKKMLIFTGVLIGAVLIQMVGNTVHVFQIVGWLPIHPVGWLGSWLPFWTGRWFGLYATWEGIGLQVVAAVFVLGSYYLAERMHKRTRPASPVPSLKATQ